jgi:tetratricopeptide (TPR) repeat protein
MAQCLYEDAEAAYQRAITSEPTCPAPYYNLGCLYCIRGRKEDGLALLAKAIAIDEVFRDEARRDPDLDSMRGDPAFHRLVYVTRREDSITGR